MRATVWRSRIVDHGVQDPATLIANPSNWRVHPRVQQAALAGILDRVGWVQDVIVNRRTGHVVDGHLRVSLAASRGEPTIPVVYVDLEEDEERLILASLDPLSGMAVTDADMLADLLSTIAVEDDALAGLLSEMAVDAGNVKLGAAPAPSIRQPEPVVKVVLTVPQLEEFEDALESIGTPNRGEALMAIVRAYNAQKG